MEKPQKICTVPFPKIKKEKIEVMKATENNIWINHITPILTAAELNEFILFGKKLHQ
jgi:hypothetical protein